ncbi:MAG TPA: isochorismatase family protein [Burkholderiales bacterium]|nr:isochorismatase family protein [Burkholderiales bacterium]
MADLDIYRKQNFGNRIGFGRRAALVIVDFTVGFNDPSLFGGGNIDPAVKRTVGLLQFFRDRRLPVAFTRVVYADDGSDAGVFCMKAPSLRMLTESAPAGQVVPELRPLPGEYMIRKTQASAFFGTGFAPWLVQQGADTLVVTGCTTSGCVRATVVDAMQHNFRAIVARDCVGDRALGPHEANLFDMGQKYADILDRDEIIAELTKLARAA